MPNAIVTVSRDGELKFAGVYLSKDEAENAAFAYLLKTQGQSVDYATKHGGWLINTITDNRVLTLKFPELSREFYVKCEDIAQKIGVSQLAAIVPFSRAEIMTALAAGDFHLNTLPLAKWDRAHPLVSFAKTGAVVGPWSLSDTVCTLKHVAKHYIAPGRRQGKPE